MEDKRNNACVSNILLEAAAAVVWPGHWQLGSDGPFQRATAELGRQQWGRADSAGDGIQTRPFCDRACVPAPDEEGGTN